MYGKNEYLCLVVKKCLAYLLAALTLASCQGLEEFVHGPRRDSQQYRRVFMIYSAGYNNLSGDLQKDIDDLCQGAVPEYTDPDVLLVFSHKAPSNGNYSEPQFAPVVERIFKDRGKLRRDTLSQFSIDSRASQPEVLESFLTMAARCYPAPSYGLLISSHGTGWIPKDYVTEKVGVNSIISHYTLQSDDMNIDELAGAIPYRLDFLIFDACLMGGVETLYALRNKAQIIAASPTEVLSEGYCYTTICDRIFTDGPADVQGAAQDFFEQYKGINCTIAVYKAEAINGVARACKVLADKYSAALLNVPESKVQSYNKSKLFEPPCRCFFDLKDMFVACGATEQELKPLTDSLALLVTYKNTTPSFFETKIDADRYSGVSCYLPRTSRPNLNDAYKNTEWNIEVGMVR